MEEEYKEEIIKMLNDINDTETLMKIYTVIITEKRKNRANS